MLTAEDRLAGLACQCQDERASVGLAGFLDNLVAGVTGSSTSDTGSQKGYVGTSIGEGINSLFKIGAKALGNELSPSGNKPPPAPATWFGFKPSTVILTSAGVVGAIILIRVLKGRKK